MLRRIGTRIKRILLKPSVIVLELNQRGWLNWLPDKLFLKMIYQVRMGKKLDIRTPTTLNEKINWLKLYDRNPVYTKLADKIV